MIEKLSYLDEGIFGGSLEEIYTHLSSINWSYLIKFIIN